MIKFLAGCLLMLALATTARAAQLVIARDGQTTAQIVVAADAGQWEKQAANDLQKYIALMSGAQPPIVADGPAVAGGAPQFFVGQAALRVQPNLQAELDRVKKKNPLLQADAIIARREGNRVLLAGSNDQSHYFAVSWLLQRWGCRWYLPTPIGECIPNRPLLTLDKLDFVYAPPFEIRNYWIAWTGDKTGRDEFQRRNFMNSATIAGGGHALAKYTADLVPAGQTIFNISFSDPKTAAHIAAKIEPQYAAGESISLAIEDGNYENDSPSDRNLIRFYDKYMLKPSLTDAMITLYNNVGKILRERYPDSPAKIGGLAYANVMMPPRLVTQIEPNVVIWLAPIDIDPNHGMDDPRSPPRQEYGAMMREWARLLDGRLAIYDYDQGQLVWRDLPNPSQHAVARDMKGYEKAGITGISTESRGATATVFLNLFFRGQLMWNPDADVTKLQNEFYGKFYGPAQKPMAKYWDTIFDAWKNTVVTEHEFFVIPAIYTPAVVETLREPLAQAEKIVAPLATKAAPTRDEKLVLERIEFARASFAVIDNYTAKVWASANQVDYARAAEFADKGLAARDALGQLNPTFISTVNEGSSAAWWKGEPAFMRELLSYTAGDKGVLVAKTPLEWHWKSEAPLPANWRYGGMEGETPVGPATLSLQRPTPENGWRKVSTGIYLQGQNILAPDGQSYTGTYWYQTELNLSAQQIAGPVHLMFPGLFNEAWLYVNGERVGHRPYTEPWWLTDYKLTWDVDLSGHLRPGVNTIALRGLNVHHFGGMFRRPFVYRARSGS